MTLSKDVPFQKNMDLGVGFDYLTGETRGCLFDRSSIVPTPGLGGIGQNGMFFMTRVDDVESLMSLLNISVEVSGRYGLFGGDAQMDFMDKSSFNSQSTFLVAKVQIQKSESQFYDAKVKDIAKDLVRSGNEKRFKELYGDFYVQSVTEGGEFSAIVEIISTCKEDEKTIAGALEASYGTPIAGVDLKVDVNNEKLSKISRKEINIYIKQVGGTGVDMIFHDEIDKLIESAKNFSLALAGNHGVNCRAQLKSYKTLDDLPESNYMLIQAKEDALNDCARKRLKYKTLLNDIDFYDVNPTFFEPDPVISDDQLTNWKSQLTQLDNLIRSHAVKIADDVNFNDDFLEVINGNPVNLSEMKLPKRIAVSSTQQEIIIPNLKTLTLDDAIKEIAREKLPLNVSYVQHDSPDAKQTMVTNTDPAPGQKVEPGAKLTIYYDGPPSPRFRDSMLTATTPLYGSLLH
ncbi:MAG: PASTA domain-containing protein [Chitinophaga sp.]|uniref:PASTA domain-containing protein n=1 Tax=Chitinophaga sp. TaxID=1869181 RepID=UPI0025BB0E96|nr:PASTA domain-containing protein [Chitinophaga sp.]MBV8253650.1 PASTA domain-containing protein [Chitinophaga sp.]